MVFVFRRRVVFSDIEFEFRLEMLRQENQEHLEIVLYLAYQEATEEMAFKTIHITVGVVDMEEMEEGVLLEVRNQQKKKQTNCCISFSASAVTGCRFNGVNGNSSDIRGGASGGTGGGKKLFLSFLFFLR